MTYMIMEINSDFVIALDERGAFVKVKNNNFVVGQKTQDVILFDSFVKKPVKRRLIEFGAFAASFAVIFAFAFGLLNFRKDKKDYASVYFAALSSSGSDSRVDIIANEAGEVIRLEYLNDSGKNLMDGYSFKGKSINDVSMDLIENALTKGLLFKGDSISFDINSPSDSWFEKYGVGLRSFLASNYSDDFTFTISRFRDDQAAESTASTSTTTSAKDKNSDTSGSVSTTLPSTPTSPTQQTEPTSPDTNPLNTENHDRTTDTPAGRETTATPSKTEPHPTSPTTQGGYITAQQALDIAIKHSGVDRAKVSVEQNEFDFDDGRAIYEIEFKVNEDEYDYEIDALTGAIIDFDFDIDDD